VQRGNRRDVQKTANSVDCLPDYSLKMAIELESRWTELCSRYATLISENSIWRFNRPAALDEPRQGWKLHVSATVLTAGQVLETVAKVLRGSDIQFKVPVSLLEVSRINAGIYYGYSQVGKIITVYPRSDDQAVRLGKELHHFTRHLSAPAVPFDGSLGSNGCVYYRYGAFRQIEESDNQTAHLIRDLEGNLVPDLRDSESPGPTWVSDPFPGDNDEAGKTKQSPLTTRYRVLTALKQRGKGGVYLAVDISVSPPRLCVIKEGRRIGEVGFDGRDGLWRVNHEANVIKALRAAGVNAPEIISTFRLDGNFYLVLEFIEGENLQRQLLRRQRKLTIVQALNLVAKLACLLTHIHSAGWVWRDCKPGNLIIGKGGSLRPLDFEGACRVNNPDLMPWGTMGFTPPRKLCGVTEDLYGLGATLYFLLSGHLPAADPRPLGKLRRSTPKEVQILVSELLRADPHDQPITDSVVKTLTAVLSDLAPDQTSTKIMG
jgi:hypothetical protein